MIKNNDLQKHCVNLHQKRERNRQNRNVNVIDNLTQLGKKKEIEKNEC